MSEKEHYTIKEIEEELSERYPNMYLSCPLDTELLPMNGCETNFAKLLGEKGLIVFREPVIEGVDCRPDFFVYNPNTGNGKLVEITLMSGNGNGRRGKKVSSQTRKRKERQLEGLEQSGIPYVVLYREHLSSIRGSCCENLF